MPNENNEIITLEGGVQLAKKDVISVFSDTAKITPYLDKIAETVTVPASDIDLKTDKGRKAIASRAHKVSKIKTQLKRIGKDSIEDLKVRVTKVHSGIAFVEESLDALKVATRAPLNQWEADQKLIEEEKARKEQERVDSIRVKIDSINDLAELRGGESIDDISSLIDALSNIDCSEDFYEFASDALKTIADCKSRLSDQMQALIQQKQQDELNSRLEAERKESVIKDRLNNLRMIPMQLMGKPSLEIQAKIDSLEKYEIPQLDFGNSYQDAVDAKGMTINQLSIMKDQAQIVEKAKREEDNRIAKAEAERARIRQEEQAKAQAEREQQEAPIVNEPQPKMQVVDTTQHDHSWREHVAPVVPEAERPQISNEPSDKDHIASHVAHYCNIDMNTAMAIAECLTTTDVPFITYNRKAA